MQQWSKFGWVVELRTFTVLFCFILANDKDNKRLILFCFILDELPADAGPGRQYRVEHVQVPPRRTDE
jgi:hypothetical protein